MNEKRYLHIYQILTKLTPEESIKRRFKRI
jgi:hypothetical protein